MPLHLFRRLRRRRHDIEEELETHIELEAKMLMDRGLPRDQAWEEARRVFGNRTIAAENTRTAWVATWLDRLWNDLRYALRTSARAPSFTVAAVLSIALGVGSATAIFAIADAVFLRPLPYPHPDELVSVGIRFPAIAAEFLPSPDYVAWRRDNRSFLTFAATQAGGPQTVLLNGSPAIELSAARVSSNFLSTFRITPVFGRDFNAADERPGTPGTVLLSWPLWKRSFHGSRSAIGEVISLDGRSYTIIGVLPRSFTFPADSPVDLISTLPVSPTATHHDRQMSIWAAFGRLKRGTTIRQAQSDLARLFELSKADMPVMFRRDTELVVEPLTQRRTRDAGKLFLVLLGTVSCLLLISSANVSNLLLGRWAARESEFALRIALGADRGRLIRQLFTEILLLAFAGAFLGAAFASAAIHAFVYWAAAGVPRLAEITIDSRVLLIGIAISGLTALFFGLLPSFVARRADLRQSLVHTPASQGAGGFRRLRQLLVVSEVALSVVLLSAAALLLESLWNLRNHQLGFEVEHALTIDLPVKGTSIEHRQREFASEFLPFLRALPGTLAATQSECTPLTGGPFYLTFSRSDRPLPQAFERGRNIRSCGAGPDYDRASGQHIVRGRFFTPQDAAHPQSVAVINETAARSYFPGEDPLGRQILGGRAAKWKTVVGIISDSKNDGLNKPPVPQALINEPSPETQRPLFLLRTLADPRLLQPSIIAKLNTLGKGLLASYKTLEQDMGEKTAGPRFDALLIASFAAIAFVMTVVGIYGVLSFTVAARTAEIGIRLAVGAQPVRLFASVLTDGIVLAFVGVCTGVCCSLLLARYLRSLVYGISVTDASTYAGVVVALLLVAILAAAIPARRAASVDPVIALRHN